MVVFSLINNLLSLKTNRENFTHLSFELHEYCLIHQRVERWRCAGMQCNVRDVVKITNARFFDIFVQENDCLLPLVASWFEWLMICFLSKFLECILYTDDLTELVLRDIEISRNKFAWLHQLVEMLNYPDPIWC